MNRRPVHLARSCSPSRRIASTAALTVAALIMCSSIAAQRVVKTSEGSIRRRATTHVMPVYPQSLVQKRTAGVAVATVRLNLDGTMERVDVLEAPDPQIAAAVTSALNKWIVPETKVVGSTERFQTVGKLTFYFLIKNGKGVVLNPDEMPGNSDVFAPPGPATRGAATTPPVNGMSKQPIDEIDRNELRKVRNEGGLLLDVRERHEFRRQHTDGAVNLPFDELPVRARPELVSARSIAIDCAFANSVMCDQAGQVLRRLGFAHLKVVIP
jgi:rhodanese-related sulfurtransferase